MQINFQILVCAKSNLIVSLTRGGVGFWNLQNGALEHTVADSPSGGISFFKIKMPFFHASMRLQGTSQMSLSHKMENTL